MIAHAAIREFIQRRGLKLHRNVKWEAADYDVPQDGAPPDREPAATLDEAEAVSSLLPDPAGMAPPGGLHDLLIDVDLEAHLIDSSTPGHHHLYVPLGCMWEDYLAFLRAAVVIGLVEDGYVNACEARGATSLRLPWVRKGDERPAETPEVAL